MGHTYLHSTGSRCNVGARLSADDVTGVSPVTDRDFLAMVAMKPGMNRAGTDVLTPGVTTPAPARDECQEALIIPTGRGEA
uniref:DUF1263 domain-containing protein n=1 Tax=Oryza sativa subsp. japonica TaxID=39947 RepID=Q852D3_ORYSJ|nr:hypothetical protein [Oryza sativa Japonica Group]